MRLASGTALPFPCGCSSSCTLTDAGELHQPANQSIDLTKQTINQYRLARSIDQSFVRLHININSTRYSNTYIYVYIIYTGSVWQCWEIEIELPILNLSLPRSSGDRSSGDRDRVKLFSALESESRSRSLYTTIRSTMHYEYNTHYHTVRKPAYTK